MIRFILLTSWVYFSYFGVLPAQLPQLSFKHLSTEQGLSQGTNAYIYRDSRGFVWISSLDGLNRFDGIEVKIYKPNPNDSLSLKGGLINSPFLEDAQGNLWFTTYEALHCYQRAYDNFKSFQFRDEKGQLIEEDYLAFYLDKNKQLWLRIGVGEKGHLYLFDIETLKERISYPLDGHRCNVILDKQGEVKQIISSMFFTRPGIEITDMGNDGKKTAYPFEKLYKDLKYNGFTYNTLVENDSTVWIGAMGKLIEFNPQTGQVRNNFHSNFEGEFLGSIWSMVAYRDNYLFAATLDGGILLLDKKQAAFVQQFQYNPQDNNSLNSNRVRELYLDNQDNLWVSRYQDGIAYTNINKVKFETLEDTKGKHIHAVFKDETTQRIWVSADKEIQEYDFNKKKIASYKTRQDMNEVQQVIEISPIHEPIQIIFNDSESTLWMVILTLIYQFNPETKQLQSAKEFPTKINDAITLKDGTMLLALDDSLTVFQHKNNFQSLPFTALDADRIGFYTRIFEDQQQRLYLANNAASLLVYSKQQQGYQVAQKIENTGYCYYFHEDTKNQVLWVATAKGLLKIATNTLEYELFNEQEQGLPAEVYHSAIPDDKGQLWLSSNRGILRYNILEKNYHRFSIADGLQGREFMANVAVQRANGEIWMGGTNGLNVFHPNQMEQNSALPQVQLTRLLVNDEPYVSPIQIGEIQALELPYYQNTISLNFVALEFSDAPNNTFKYQLLGKNYNSPDEWIDNNKRGFVRFANLPTGEYVLNIKAANTDGIWNEQPKTLHIAIIPPFWQTTWAYLLYILTIGAGLYWLYRFNLKRQLEKAEAAQLKELNELKTRFYTNITHEFRTPLTVILGMSKQLASGNWQNKVSKKEQNLLAKGFGLIERNGKKLLKLINQILDLSKLDTHNLKPHYQPKEIVAFVKYVGESFESLAMSKGVQLTIYSEIEKLVMETDLDKLQKIISNLLSNAIKFTDAPGKVILHLAQKDNLLQIKVKDTGAGIAKKELPHIFDRFYQTDNSLSRKGEGTGIGLALVKELVELMEGSIQVKSELGRGTEFVVLLPIRQPDDPAALYDLEEERPTPIVDSSLTDTIPLTATILSENDHSYLPESLREPKQLPQLLIAEDNVDVIHYIQSVLAPHYQIEIANDGQEGIDKALETIPDIIISDVMMPRKNGFELVETLKQDERTSHIPIILLTAKATQQDKIAGLKYGADAYLMKPFDKEELFVRLEKLLEIRKALQNRYAKEVKALLPKAFGRRAFTSKSQNSRRYFPRKTQHAFRKTL